MTINEDKLNDLIGQFVTDFGAAHARRHRGHRRQARAVQGPGRPGPDRRGAALAEAVGYDERLVEEWLERAVREPATRSTTRRPVSSPSPRSRWRCSPTESTPGLPGRGPDDHRRHLEGRGDASARPSGRVGAWAGTSTTTTCSTAPRGCSSPGTRATSSTPWIPRSRASPRSSASTGPPSPTSAAGTDPRRSSWPRRTRRRRSPASTTTSSRSTSARKRAAEAGVADRVRFEVASRPGLPGHRLRPDLHLRRPPRHGRSGRAARPTSAKPWPTTGRGCWSSRWPSPASRTT